MHITHPKLRGRYINAHTHTLKFRVCLACLPSPPPPPPSPSHSWPLSSGSPIIPRSPGSASAVNGFPRAPLALFRQFRQVFCAPIEPHYKLFILSVFVMYISLSLSVFLSFYLSINFHIYLSISVYLSIPLSALKIPERCFRFIFVFLEIVWKCLCG